MKKKILLIALVGFFSIVLADSPGLKRIYKTKAITFYGLDFTKAAFIGDFSTLGDLDGSSPSVIRNMYMVAWNEILIQERRKYNISEAYNKDSLYYRINSTIERNSKIDTNSIFKRADDVFYHPHLKTDDIKTIVSNIQNDANTAIGLVYVVDFFNKETKQGCIWVVFFDTKTKEILHHAAFIEAASGFGLRNFWSGVVHRTMLTSSQLYHTTWRKHRR